MQHKIDSACHFFCIFGKHHYKCTKYKIFSVKKNLNKFHGGNCVVMAINWRFDLFLEEYERIADVSITTIHKVREFFLNALCNMLFYKTRKPDQWKEIATSLLGRMTNVNDAFVEYTGIQPTLDILSFFTNEIYKN